MLAMRHIRQAAPANTPLPRMIAHWSNQKSTENQPPRDRIVLLNSEICGKFLKGCFKSIFFTLHMEVLPLLTACVPTLKMDTVILAIPIVQLE